MGPKGNVASKWTIEAFIRRITQTVLFLFYFFVSSICSTSLDSSTTLPLIMVCVTTFTILRVRTSGSSVDRKTEMLAICQIPFKQTDTGLYAQCFCGWLCYERLLCLAVFNVSLVFSHSQCGAQVRGQTYSQNIPEPRSDI